MGGSCGQVVMLSMYAPMLMPALSAAWRRAAAFVLGEGAESIPEISVEVDGRVRYTVPQRISTLKDTTLYFRVSDVFRDKKLVVKDGERVIVERKKQKLAPGEMETVKLTRDMIKSVESGKIKISLEDIK